MININEIYSWKVIVWRRIKATMMNRNTGFIRSIWNMTKRGIHYKENPKKYPKVNIEDVQLEKPRYGFRKEREPLLSQSVTDTLFPSSEIKSKYLQAGKPVPIKYRSNSDNIARRNYEKYKEEVAMGEPHFRVGEKKVYLPKARICLLRPNAKHTPYQAKFLVPRNFNKMDLRDYLWHVYGLRALNVTVQLLHAKFNRGPDDHARYRGPQFKKMTIDMEEPFMWPELPSSIVEKAKQNYEDQIEAVEMKTAVGSDKLKPSKAFNGLYSKPELPNMFVPRTARKVGKQSLDAHREQDESRGDRQILQQYLGL